MANRDEIIKRNIAFMYGRNKEEETLDPDKRSVVRTSHKYVERDIIKSFTEEYEYLAPGFPCDVVLSGDSTIYPSFEHALQASKTSDPAIKAQLKEISDVRELKRVANRLCRVSDIWREGCSIIAEQLLRDKFFRNKALTANLMKTEHRTIQYVNDFKDMFWGMSPDLKGQNKLGKLIESVRYCIEKGNILDLWIKDHFKLIHPDKISITVKVMKDGEELKKDRETFNKKPMLEIGKIDDNDVITPHPTTSRRHALLIVDECRGALLLDLTTPNGTFVDGTRISPLLPVSIVSDSSVVLFGASRREYMFIIDTEADRRRRDEIYMKMSNPEVAKDSNEDCTIFVGNLPYDCTEEQLRNVFESCGGIRSLTLPRDRGSAQEGGGRGIAFITFDTVSGLRQALTRDGDDLGGRMMKVKRSEAKSRVHGGGGGGTGRTSQGPKSGGQGHGRGDDSKEEESYYMPRPTDRAKVANASDGRDRYDRPRGGEEREGSRDKSGRHRDYSASPVRRPVTRRGSEDEMYARRDAGARRRSEEGDGKRGYNRISSRRSRGRSGSRSADRGRRRSPSSSTSSYSTSSSEESGKGRRMRGHSRSRSTSSHDRKRSRREDRRDKVIR